MHGARVKIIGDDDAQFALWALLAEEVPFLRFTRPNHAGALPKFAPPAIEHFRPIAGDERLSIDLVDVANDVTHRVGPVDVDGLTPGEYERLKHGVTAVLN